MDGKARLELIQEKMLENVQKIDPDSIYKPRKGDLFVVGPIKSGTTWMQQILHQIRTKGDESFNDIYDVTWFMWPINAQHFNRNLNEEQTCNPRVFKIHDSFENTQTTLEQKHVVIVRNPYDAAYSWLKYRRRWYGDEADFDEADAAKHFVERNAQNSLASMKCISTWWEHRNDANVLYVFYEDLLKDLKTLVCEVAKFVDLPLTEEELNRVTYLSSFEYMAKNKERFQGGAIINYMAPAAGMETWKPKLGMVREDGGKAGNGTQIGPKLRNVLDKIWKEQMDDKFGFATYEDMYAKNSFFKQP